MTGDCLGNYKRSYYNADFKLRDVMFSADFGPSPVAHLRDFL